MRLLLRFSLLFTVFVAVCGCMDGPFYAMKRLNPYFQSQWREDRALGPTFADRLKELEKLEARMDSLGPSEQTQVAEKLARTATEDPSPEVRIAAIRSMAQLPAPSVVKALNTASVDEVEKVRLATCEAWQVRGGQDARDMLLSMAKADDSGSVRQAAIESLGDFDDPAVLRTLADLLDERSPAINYCAAQSLAKLTGKEYGGDFKQWQAYVADLPRDPGEGTLPPELGSSPVRTVSGEGFPPIPNLPEIP